MNLIISALKKLIQAYHWLVSPWLGSRCRFVPSCSEYAQQSLDQHGVIRGLALTVKRLLRCHPWGGEGFDPVPRSSTKSIDNKRKAQKHLGSDDY